MTTDQIEQFANMGDLSSPDIDLKVLLRRNVAPAFLAEVGYVTWRRVDADFPLIPGQSDYDLREDFGIMQSVALAPDLSCELLYLGDSPQLRIPANASTTPGKPGGFFLCWRLPSLIYKAIHFDCPPDQSYHCHYAYYRQFAFPDDVSDVDMDEWIPSQFQWGLVEGLKREIMYLRFGVSDSRYTAAAQAYSYWVQLAQQDPELAHRSAVSFVR